MVPAPKREASIYKIRQHWELGGWGHVVDGQLMGGHL